MGWFDEQIKQRKQFDDELFNDAFLSVADAVMGKRLTEALAEKEIASSAIGEIFKYFRIKEKYQEIPAGIKTVDEQLEFRMRPYGIMRRKVTIQDDWYKNATGPMLGTLKEDGRAVALVPGKIFGYVCLDFKTGKCTKINRQNAAMIDEEAYCFYRAFPLRKITVKDIFVFMLGQLSFSDILLYFGMMGVSALLGLLSPMFTKWLFSDVIQSESTQVLLSLAIFMLCFSISSFLVNAYKGLIQSRVNIKLDVAVEAAVMSRILSLPPKFFRDFGAGELSQRSQYIQMLCNVFMESVVGVGLTSVFSLVYIFQIFAFAPALTLPATITTFLVIIVSILSTMGHIKQNEKMMLATTKESGMSFAMISGIQKIKLAGAEKRMFSRWAKVFAEETHYSINPPLFLKLNLTIPLAITLISTIVIYWVALNSGVSVSDYYAFNTAYALVTGAFTSLAGITVAMSQIKPILDMAKPIMNAEPEISEGKEVVASLHGAIELNNVSFRYDETMPMIIDDMSLKIRPGEYVAIVGSTGCGKSTLMRLLLGFEKPLKGAIYYDGKDMSKLDLKSLRRKIGTVMQDGKLFQGDIFSNIVISAPQLTLKDAWEAAEIASIADDIRAMPMEMFTFVSEGQGGISGGQRQRLMIARAIAPKPKILMFDEATSALDNITQRKVSEAIDSLKCTRIVIAHRLSTIRHCSRIIVLDKGKIIEEGTYEQLIENKGFFSELVARQRIDVEEDEIN